MINVIDTKSRSKTPMPAGTVRHILSPSNDKTKVHVAIEEVDKGKEWRVPPSDETQVVYLLQGDAELTHNKAVHPAKRGCGLYLEPGEEGTVKALGTPLILLHVVVPKHTSKPIKRNGNEKPAGYFFNETKLQALVDEKQIRTRTFWVNKETGLSGSWDMQIGRMLYGPKAYSPRHVHRATATNPTGAEHFYFIEKGTGEVLHDTGKLAIGPGNLIFIPAGEWHQLIASDTGLDYIEFQAPFDFSTTMDQDPLGKNWYIQGTDDGTGRPKLWVQS